jgi:Protein of unknown function (DUF559)
MCREHSLIVELDGGQHAEQEEQDSRRTRWLEAHGFRVLRFWNNEVMDNLDGVLQTIEAALFPSPRPSPEGEGAVGRAGCIIPANAPSTPSPSGEGASASKRVKGNRRAR